MAWDRKSCNRLASIQLHLSFALSDRVRHSLLKWEALRQCMQHGAALEPTSASTSLTMLLCCMYDCTTASLLSTGSSRLQLAPPLHRFAAPGPQWLPCLAAWPAHVSHDKPLARDWVRHWPPVMLHADFTSPLQLYCPWVTSCYKVQQGVQTAPSPEKADSVAVGVAVPAAVRGRCSAILLQLPTDCRKEVRHVAHSRH